MKICQSVWKVLGEFSVSLGHFCPLTLNANSYICCQYTYIQLFTGVVVKNAMIEDHMDVYGLKLLWYGRINCVT